MWELFTAAMSNMGSELMKEAGLGGDGSMLSNIGNQLMKDPVLAAGKGLFDTAAPASDPSQPPAPNKYATLLSSMSGPVEPMPHMQSPVQIPQFEQPVPNLGFGLMPPMRPLARQAYGRYF